MDSRSKFLLLIVLSAILGAAIWVLDRSRSGDGAFDPDPVVVDLSKSGDGAALPGSATVEGAASENAIETAGSATSTGAAAGGTLAEVGPDDFFPPGEDVAEAPQDKPPIESFDAYVTDAGIVLEWISGDESSDDHDTIGYRVYRVATNGTETLVADMTTAALGEGELYNLTESGKDGGHFVIDRVNRDLSVTRLPFSTTARMVAPPEDGLHVIMIQAESGEAEIDVGSDARNLFIIGFQNKPVVEDRSDPDNPRVLVGETISLRGEQAVYFKADSFTRIRVAE